jgi:uncharacterized membrane protein (TIGR02234 family)
MSGVQADGVQTHGARVSGARVSGSSRRAYALALVLIGAGAVGALLATQASWVTTTTQRTAIGLPTVLVVTEQKGAEVAGSVVGLALLALAGVLAVVATRGWLRRAVGVLLALAGLGIVWACVSFVRAPLYRLDADGVASTENVHEALTGWPLVSLVGGLLVVAGAVLVVWRGAQWSAMSARYDAPAPRAGERQGDTWAALDRGEDPTTDLGDPGDLGDAGDPGPRPADPDLS